MKRPRHGVDRPRSPTHRRGRADCRDLVAVVPAPGGLAARDAGSGTPGSHSPAGSPMGRRCSCGKEWADIARSYRMKARGGAARLDAGELVEVLAGPRASTAIDDDWLNQLADTRHRNATIASVLAADAAGSPEPPEGSDGPACACDAAGRARRRPGRHPSRHGRPNLAAATTKQIQLDLANAESTVIAWAQQHRTGR
jgi:hypothetical protein